MDAKCSQLFIRKYLQLFIRKYLTNANTIEEIMMEALKRQKHHTRSNYIQDTGEKA